MPEVNIKCTPNTAKFIGNNQKIQIASTGGDSVMVLGSNCKVTIGRNRSQVNVIGDRCEIKVLDNIPNEGFVNYVGNKGLIVLGDHLVPEDVIKCTGNNNRIIFVGQELPKDVKFKKNHPKTRTMKKCNILNLNSISF